MTLKKIKTALIRIPKRFYDDHVNRDLDAPSIAKETRSHYWIHGGPGYDLDELREDAEFYANHVDADRYTRGIIRSAKATLEAIEKARD